MAFSLRDNGNYDAFKALVAEAEANGITIIAAAGNKNADASGYIPANINGVITVGAIDADGYKISTSNYGDVVEYYVNAESTSQAAAGFAGKYIAGTTSDVATSYETESGEYGTGAETLDPDMLSDDAVWDEAISIAGGTLDYTKNFYIDEWIKVVQAQEAYSQEKYIKATRIGRGLRLDRIKRIKVWKVFEEYMHLMDERKMRDAEFDYEKMFPEGCRIRHTKFRNGTVKKVSDGIITVLFDNGVTKDLGADVCIERELIKKI